MTGNRRMLTGRKMDDREWLVTLLLKALALPFVLLVGLLRLVGRGLAATVRNRQKDLERVKRDTEMLKALAEYENAAAELRERERSNKTSSTSTADDRDFREVLADKQERHISLKAERDEAIRKAPEEEHEFIRWEYQKQIDRLLDPES